MTAYCNSQSVSGHSANLQSGCAAHLRSAVGHLRTFPAVCAMSAIPRRIQPVRATPSNLLRGEEVRDGDVTDLVHGSAEGRAVGAMEARAKCCGHLSGAGKEEQDRR